MANTVGTEVISYCGKCKIGLNHVIVAMEGTKIKKLRCNTCGSLHGYRSPNAAEKIQRKKVGLKKQEVQKQDHMEYFQNNLKRLRSKDKRSYGVSETFSVDDIVDHKIFGVGFVSKVADPEKIEVVFETGVKLLVHGRA